MVMEPGKASQNPEEADKNNEGETDKDEPKAEPAKNKGFGFVHFALEDDCMKALEALKSTKFLGRKLKGELALKKHVKFDHDIIAKELPKARPSPAKSNAKVNTPKVLTNQVSVKFLFTGVAVEFNKKQLYKKVRKTGELKELQYPLEGDASKALVTFSTPEEATKACRKLDKHIFKAIKMEASVLKSDKAVPSSSSTVTKKAHRLIVRNLPFSVTPAELDEQFGSFGRVLEIVLPTKPGGTQPKGFAFVQFEEKEAAVFAMAALNGKEISGRTVAVDWAIGKTLYEQIVKSEQTEKNFGEEEKIVDVEGDSASESEEVEVDVVGTDSEESSSDEDDDKTVFVRNIAYETNEQALTNLFAERFGPLEYCKLVVNPGTGTSRGTAFIKFKSVKSAKDAIEASLNLSQDQVKPEEEKSIDASLEEIKKKRAGKNFKSMLIDEDEQGNNFNGILIDGRALSVVQAVDRDKAKSMKLAQHQETPNDKRRLGLLDESLIKPVTPVANKFWSQADRQEREAMIKARLKDLRKNPNSILSNVRLSIRHLPTSVDESMLKTVIEHVLSEANQNDHGILDDQPAMKENAQKSKLRLKQVKIVRSTGEERENRAGRSKGFAFVEFNQPAHALLALRYMTNCIPDVWNRCLPEIFGRRSKPDKKDNNSSSKPLMPVVEFAIDKTAVLDKKSGAKGGGRPQQVHRQKRPSAGRPSAGPNKRSKKK